jgi:hypothetical protein
MNLHYLVDDSNHIVELVMTADMHLGDGYSYLFQNISFCFLTVLCRVPVDPLEWQISQEMANSIVASLANTFGAAESVLRVAATGHDKKLLFKVIPEL